ncbi:MAG: MutS family DNA mismatch repair protein [Firmicutes bacterium]|nr:MutS family DNA mismatch repair protein [Bacillota bacterium]
MIKQDNVYRYLSYILAVLALFSLAVGMALWKNAGPYFYYWLAVFVLLIIGAAAAHLWHKKLKTQHFLRNSWGKEVRRDRDFSEIGSLYELTAAGAPGDIDSQTWGDLDMDQVYHKLDRTLTNPGEAVLYDILRRPLKDGEMLLERARMLRFFQHDTAVREKLRLTLYRLGKQDLNNITTLLWGELPARNPLRPLFTVLALASLFSLAAPFLWGARALFIIAALFSLDMWVHYRVRRGFIYNLPAISYLGALLRRAPQIASLGIPGGEKYKEQLRDAAGASRKILRQTRFLTSKVATSDVDFLLEYMKVFFLLEVRGFYAALREIEKQRTNLQSIYLRVGELDAFQSIASFRSELEDYSEPEFVPGGSYLNVKEARHPLLDKAVPNTIELKDQGVLITGSNMSGKSTFLKTIGVNALLAQSICTCLAQSYVSCFFKIGASLGKSDSLAEGKSLYYMEAERLLTLVNAAGDSAFPSLCLIDEVLSGTNYIERIAAAEAILSYLAAKNALVIVATHDLDLAQKLKDAYRCYHFTDHVGREGLYFDYILKEGLTTTRNAIKLLEQMEYPEEIVTEAATGVSQYCGKLDVGGSKPGVEIEQSPF